MDKITDSEESRFIERIRPPKLRTFKSLLRISLMAESIAISMFQYGYWMAYLQQLDIQMIKDLYSFDMQNSTAIGLLGGCIPFGALFGSLLSLILIPKLSRRATVVITNILALIIGCLIYIPNFPLLVACRLSQGIFVGIYSSIVPLMLRQIAPKEISGTLGRYVQMNVCAGVVFAYALGYFLQKATNNQTGSEYWKYMFAVPLLVILSQTLILIFVFPYETPKYLLIQGKEEQARELLQIIYKPEYVNDIFQEKKLDLQSLKQSQKDKLASLTQPSTFKKSRIQTIIAINSAFLLQLSGVNTVVVYGGRTIRSIFTGEMAKIMPILINFEQFIATILVTLLLNRYGRKIILIVGTFITIIANTFVAIGFLIKDQYGFGIYFIITGMFVFMMVYGLSIGSVSWLYISQIAQPKFLPVPISMNWIGGSIIVILFPIVTDNLLHGNPGILFFVFVAWSIAALILNCLCMVETKGKTEKEIREQFQAIKIC